MENLASVQDELYYTAKNFNKLKFSNTAYITNTTKDKQENQKEIEKLAKEYEALKKEVEELKKKSLYSSKRLISASNNHDITINEIVWIKIYIYIIYTFRVFFDVIWIMHVPLNLKHAKNGRDMKKN